MVSCPSSPSLNEGDRFRSSPVSVSEFQRRGRHRKSEMDDDGLHDPTEGRSLPEKKREDIFYPVFKGPGMGRCDWKLLMVSIPYGNQRPEFPSFHHCPHIIESLGGFGRIVKKTITFLHEIRPTCTYRVSFVTEIPDHRVRPCNIYLINFSI